MLRRTFSLIVLFLFSTAVSYPQTTPAQLTGPEIAARVKPSVALVLAGEGAGRLSATASAVCVSPNGVLLTAYHAVKDAREVQVRLPSGEIYDNVQMLGTDTRRDVAAIRIPAAGLPVLPIAQESDYKVGETVYVISNPGGLAWSASSGILSAVRMADEIPGAGQGFHLLQFTAPVSPGSSGGVLVDDQGRAMGLVTGSLQGQNLNFAVPLINVQGLGNSNAPGTAFGPGSDLQLPKPTPTGTVASRAAAKSDPNELLRDARTVAITSRTTFFTPDLLSRALMKQPTFKTLNLKIVTDVRVADLIIQVDRPLFTYDFTYTLTSPATSIELASGKVIAFDGVHAAPKIAKNLMKVFQEAGNPPASHGQK